MGLFRHPIKLPTDRDYFDSMLAGSEAGISTTAGIIIGIGISGQTLALTAAATFIAIFVQAFNSAANRYLSVKTANEIEDIEDKKIEKPLHSAGLQLGLHLLMGSILIFPLLYFQISQALWIVFFLSIFMLLIVGLLKGKFVPRKTLLHALEIVLIGLLVMSVGLLAGVLTS